MNTKKLLAVLVSVAMCGAAFAGCGNNADSSKAESKAEFSSSQVEKMPETDEEWTQAMYCLLYTSPSPRDLSTSRMPSSA